MVSTRTQMVTGTARKQSAGTNPRTSITIHQTGNTSRGANAKAHATLMSNGNARSASWHWTVDDKEAVQSYPHTAKCWHAGRANGNNTSIAIELCINSDGNYIQTLQNGAELTAQIMKQEGLSIGDIVQHNRWSGKDCPAQIRAGMSGVNWTTFLNMVRNALSGSTPTPPAPITPPVSPPKPPVAPNPAPSANEFVKSFQLALNKAGYYNGWIDGIQGPATTDAITRYQRSQVHPKLHVDGVWGTVTDTHYHWVRLLQTTLNQWKAVKPTIVVDGDYGANTKRAVLQVQTNNGLYRDGIAGEATCKKLGIRSR